MKVDIKELWMALKNASLYAREKTWNGGQVQFRWESDWMSISSSDDFVSVSTTIGVYEAEPQAAAVAYVSVKELKNMEKQAREEIAAGAEGLTDFVCEDGSPKDPEWWEEFDEALWATKDGLVPSKGWECSPERLALLGRLEPKGKYPLSWKPVRHYNDPLWAFRYGPNTVGVLVPLNRGVLVDQDPDIVEGLW